MHEITDYPLTSVAFRLVSGPARVTVTLQLEVELARSAASSTGPCLIQDEFSRDRHSRDQSRASRRMRNEGFPQQASVFRLHRWWTLVKRTDILTRDG